MPPNESQEEDGAAESDGAAPQDNALEESTASGEIELTRRAGDC